MHWKAVRDKTNTHGVFKKLNKDCYGPDGIDYTRVTISYGMVSTVEVTLAKVDEEGNVHVEFLDRYPTEKNKKDQFYLFLFCPDLREGHFAKPVARTTGIVGASLPEEWKGHELQLYAFMEDSKGRTSETMYLGPIRG